MSQHDEKNFAEAMAKVYNWLVKVHADCNWLTFSVVTRDKTATKGRIFPGRGDDALRPGVNGSGMFYVPILRSPDNKRWEAILNVFLSTDYSQIDKIEFVVRWWDGIRKDGDNEDGRLKDFAGQLELGQLKDHSGTDVIAKDGEENQMRKSFIDWFKSKEKVFQDQTLDKYRIPDSPRQRIEMLIKDKYLKESDEKGCVEVPDDCPEFPVPKMVAKDLQEKVVMKKESGSSQMLTDVKNMLTNSGNVILTGAPGTGKTYLAKKVALAMLGEQYANKTWDDAVTDGRVGFCQFHPSYDYSDFVEGLRPVTVGNGENAQVGFKRMDGVFKAFCKNALNGGARNWNDDFENAWKLLVSRIDEGPEFGLEIPLISGRGSFALTLNVSGSGLASQKYKDKVGDKDWISGTVKFFSREQLYNVFRGLSGVPSGGHDSYRKAIVDYMKKECGLVEYVKDNTDKQSDAASPYVFIIDEINRGDISKIFGELFFSIDPGYRGKKGLVKTQYQNLVEPRDEFENGFYVPTNVYIIGTMNDIDRSVESMDFAIRRRFVWQEVKPNSDALDAKKDGKSETDESRHIIAKEDDRDKAKKCMENLNKKICESNLLGSAYAVGQAYFLKLDSVGGFDALWKMNLEPLLREYLRGNPKQVIDDKIKEFKEAYDLGWKERVEGEVMR